MAIDAFATPLDLAALAYFLVAIGTYRLVAGARFQEARMLDANLLGSLGQGTTFFASTCAIAVGGLAATMSAPCG